METIELIRLFVKVIQHGSFTRAAAALNLPKSTLSKGVARLEADTGTKLLLRTTRSLTLTAAGRAFYDSCAGPVQTLEDARKSLHGADSILSGLIRITAPEHLGNHVVARALAELTQNHPKLNFELNCTDEVVDLIKQGFDLAVRIGRLSESRLKARRLPEITLVLVASPAYLKRAPKIRGPGDLTHHGCLTISAGTTTWDLRSKHGSVKFKVQPRIIGNQMTSLVKLATNDAGIAMVPSYLVQRELNSGELTHVLPDWRSPGLHVSLITPLSTADSARLKVVMDHLVERIQRSLSST